MQIRSTIPLKDQKKDLHIASGAFSHCYRHPNDSNLCIKITTSSPKATKRLHSDLAYYRKLHAQKKDLSHISNFLGPCLTDLGPGHLYECITDRDKTVSRTLEYYLLNLPERKGEMITALQELANYLRRNRIIVSDLHTKNILLRINLKQPPTAIIVDGIGDRIAIQIFNAFDSLIDAKIIRRWNRFTEKLLTAHPTFTSPDEFLYLSKKN